MNLGWVPSLMFYLTGILILAATFKRSLKRRDKDPKEKNLQELLEKEHSTQFVRNKALPDDLFLQIDFNAFPIVENANCHSTYLKLLDFKQKSVVNLKGHTNLELKSVYGPQVIEKVSSYERNYFEFMDILYKYGKILYENHYVKEAILTLEQSLHYHCDLSKIYLLLIDIYKEQDDKKSLRKLQAVVKNEMHGSPFLNKVLERLS